MHPVAQFCSSIVSSKVAKLKSPYLLIIYCFLIIQFIVLPRVVKDKLKEKREDQVTTTQPIKCKVFNENLSHFSVLIDGVKYPKFLPVYENKTINFKCLNASSVKPKRILLWTKFKGLPFLPELEKIIMNRQSQNVLEDFKCPVSNCQVTFDRDKLPQSDMVLFHLRNRINYFPNFRKADQHWVFLYLIRFGY